MIGRHHNIRARLKKSATRGLSLIETAMVLAVVSLLMVFLVNLSQTETDRLRSKNTADRLTTVSEAAKGYLSANYADLLAALPNNGDVQVILAGRTEPGGAIPPGSLQDEGFLQPSFIDANSFQQNTALLVRKANATTLEALVTTYGGQEIPDRMLGTMSNLVGPEGGYVPETYINAAEVGNVLGTSGGWRTVAATWGDAATRPDTGTIQMSMAFEDGEILKDYLYRNDVGVPEANRMNTNIDMNSNSINNIGKLSGINDAVTGAQTVVIGDAANPESLRATEDIWADRDVIAGRNVNATNDITAGNDVTAGNNLVARNNLLVSNDAVVGRNLRVDARINGQSLEIANDSLLRSNLTVGGNTNLQGDLKVGGVLDANMRVESTDPTHSISRATGLKLSDFLPRMVPQYSYLYVDGGGAIPFPTCRGGDGNARVMAYKQVESIEAPFNIPLKVQTAHLSEGQTAVGDVAVDNANTWVRISSGVQAVNNGNRTWKLVWTGDPPAPGTTRQAIAQTFCFYG